MNFLLNKFRESPIWARVAPFMIFVGLTALQGQFGEESRYWIYLLKTLVGVWLIWVMRPFVAEMKWAFSWEAVLVGVLIFVIWVGSYPFYPKMSDLGKPWNPLEQFGGALGWLFVVVRILGSSLVVPPIEEVFYRSFLYRYIINPNFQQVLLTKYNESAAIISAIIFGVVHHEWLAGIICAGAYQYLVIRKGRLGDAMTAHAITNLLLGLWVLGRGDWKFW